MTQVLLLKLLLSAEANDHIRLLLRTVLVQCGTVRRTFNTFNVPSIALKTHDYNIIMTLNLIDICSPSIQKQIEVSNTSK